MALYINGNKISGGGGNSNMQELTQEEYDELTTEEKNNGTVYYITDVNGDGESFQPIIYSENEREIGVWVDGKPLYEKTLNFDISENSEIFLNLSTLNIDRIISTNLNGKYVNNLYQTGNDYYYTNSDYLSAYFVNNNSYLAIRRGSEHAIIDDGYITIRYTKTTDQAGSGTWTPQGVPAVHYSTDEQVIGTWIDGKTLYEKTYVFSNSIQISSSSWTASEIDTSLMETFVNVKGVSANGDSYDGLITASINNRLNFMHWFNNIGIKTVIVQYTKSS